MVQDFSGGAVDIGSLPSLGRFHITTEQLSPYATITEPVL